MSRITPLLLVMLSLFLLKGGVESQRKCANLPIEQTVGAKDWWAGQWKYFESSERTVLINENGQIQSPSFENGACQEVVITKNHSATTAFMWGQIIIRNTKRDGQICYGCMILEQRTINVIDFKESQCKSTSPEQAKAVCKASGDARKFIQIFRQNRLNVNCKNTFEGIYQFHYERQDNEGICNNPESRIVACQEPGSAFKDNDRFTQTFKKCPGNAGSIDRQREWRCLGEWKDPENPHKRYAALWDDQEVLFEQKVKCILTQDNQQLPNNQIRYSMSSLPSCSELRDEANGPWMFQTTPDITPKQKEALQPACILPQNFSGNWFTSSQYDSSVTINSTHIRFNTLYTTFKSVDTFFSCQQTRDTRFLMKQVTQGRCEIDYVCFEFLPRHQNIIRFRMGKPYRADKDDLDSSDPKNLQRIFKLACSWSSFTVSRTENLNYVYQTFILDPPAPVDCPIGGIYNFTQTGVKQFKYQTKIRGVTERPRVAYTCDNIESEFKVCSANPKTVNLDAERCATVDHVGRPIGEYDEPDNYLQCVGYWQENQQSYLVTYDTEDSVCKFRCWVYERLGWKDIRMSRALRAACGPSQTPRSSSHLEGASLQLDLHENEREFDDCPQKFLDGRDPYMQSKTLYLLGSSSLQISDIILLLSSLMFILIGRHILS